MSQQYRLPKAHLDVSNDDFISVSDDILSCKMFVGTLKDVAHKWSVGLPRRLV